MSSEDRPERRYYRYYDTPEGCDLDKKIGATTRYAFLAGMAVGTFDSLMFSHAVKPVQMIRRYLIHTLPMVTAAVVFPVVSTFMYKTRDKDDELNYFIGGAACGPIAGLYQGSKFAMVVSAIGLGLIAAVKKHVVKNGWVFFPEPPPRLGYLQVNQYDYTIIRDPLDDLLKDCKCGK